MIVRKLAWFYSIILIAICLFSVSFLEYKDRNLFLSSQDKLRLIEEALFYEYATKKALFQSLPGLVYQIRSFFTSPNPSENIEKLLAQYPELLRYITVNDTKTGETLFTNRTLTSERYFKPSSCSKDFSFIPREHSFLFCSPGPRFEISIYFSARGLKQYIMSKIEPIYGHKQVLPLKTLFFNGRDIFLNIRPSSVIAEKNLLIESRVLLLKKLPFRMYWKGDPIYSKELVEDEDDIDSSSYHFYYNPLFAYRPLSGMQILFISIFFLLGIFTLIFGFLKRPRRFYEENLSLIKEDISPDVSLDALIDTFEPLVKEEDNIPKTRLSNLSDKDKQELKGLINEVQNPPHSINDFSLSENLESPLIPPKEDTPKNLLENIHTILNEHPSIFYTLIATPLNDEWVEIKGYHRWKSSFEYQMPSSEFFLYLATKEHPHIYLYNEAGKTTVMRYLLKSSPLSPLLIDSAIIFESPNKEFYLHLFEDPIDIIEAEDIYKKTKRLLT